MSMMSEFREFIAKGNVMDLAVGVIIGAAFQKIVDSLVNDVVMPVVGLATGGTDFSNMFTVMRNGAKVAGPVRVARRGKSRRRPGVRVGIVCDPGDSVPDSRLGRVPDGEGRQPDQAAAVSLMWPM